MQLAVFVVIPMGVLKTVCSWMELSSAAVTGASLSLRMDSPAKVCIKRKHCMLLIVNFGMFPIDVNECQEGACSHLCNNTSGGFECGCRAGFRLGLDKRSCEGK